MKYMKKSNTYKNSTGTLTFNAVTNIAHSYNWYVLAKEFNGVMYLNTFGYSMTTIKHVYQLRRLFNHLGITYREIEAPRGLQSLDESLQLYKSRALKLQELINKPRSQKAKNLERIAQITTLMTKISEVNLLKGVQ